MRYLSLNAIKGGRLDILPISNLHAILCLEPRHTQLELNGLNVEASAYCIFETTVGVIAVATSISTRCAIRCATRSAYSENLLGRPIRRGYSARLLLD